MRPAIVLLLLITLFTTTVDAQRRRAVGQRQPIERGPAINVDDDFRNGTLGWTAAFADYSTLTRIDTMELGSGIRPLPPELGVSGTGFMLTGQNRSDDLFMFLTKKLTAADGVEPAQRYAVSYRVTLASNAGGNNCVGIGGHPGYSVFLKVGAAGEEPRVELEGTQWRLTVDKGNQSQGGTAASVAGHISTESDRCFSDAPYASILRAHRHPPIVTANDFGELWLIVGTDSGFEGRTTLYYQRIEATLTPVE
jgi:hypothetical protein